MEGGFLKTSHPNTKLCAETFVQICWHIIKLTEAFLSQIVTGDETWIHHFEPETKRQSMEWYHPACPQRKKITSTSKIMIIVFWDCEGAIWWM
jgi:hypothetical protein